MDADTKNGTLPEHSKKPISSIDEKFVLLVQEREAIYDPKKKDYHKRIVVDIMWKEVAEEMGLTVSQCKQKWINLRNSYARHLRALKRYGVGNRRKGWYLADVMSFLQDHMHSRGPKIRDDSVENFLMLECSEDFEEQSGEKDQTPSPEASIVIEDAHPTQKPDGNFKVIAVDKNLGKKKANKNSWHAMTPDNVVGTVLESFTNNTMQECSEIQQHPLLQFFAGLIPEYDRLTTKRQRIFKQKSLNVLNDLLDEQEI